MITVSVPGKIMLMGDHAIVHGKPALLSAIQLRMKISVEKSKKKGISIISTEPIDYAQFAVEKVLEHFQIQKPPSLKISISSDIPAGSHLGTSAAIAVGIVAALTYAVKKLWNPTMINTLAYEIEKKQHGNPSGGDNTIITFGGLLWFRKELEFLKSIWQFPFSIPDQLNHFYLIDTGRSIETTGEMVLYVRQQMQRYPTKYKRAFDINELQTKRIAMALKENNERELIDALQQGEQTLETMGVVSKKAIRIIRTVEEQNGAAKILGGGGRMDGVGYLLCYSHSPPKGSIPIVLGEEGVRLEEKS